MIPATTTTSRLTIEVDYDPGSYLTGVNITDRELATLPRHPHHFHGEWHYTLSAQSSEA